MIEFSFGYAFIATIGGFVAGCINTLAGNGSAITLTILTELIGLPGNVANGTNRLGVWTQSTASTWAFYRNGRLDLGRSRGAIVLISLGAIVGIYVATVVSNEQFRQVFRFLMIVMLLVILVKPKRWLRETDTSRAASPWLTVPLFLLLGFYGGFIQMGMGVFFLAVMVLIAHYNIIDANAVKSAVIALYTLLAVIIFAAQGMFDWRYGLALAAGQTLGGYLTARYAAQHPAAGLWAYRLLVVVVLLAILSLFDWL